MGMAGPRSRSCSYWGTSRCRPSRAWSRRCCRPAGRPGRRSRPRWPTPEPQRPRIRSMIDRGRLADLLVRERRAFDEANPRSEQAYAEADRLFGRVPMTWMNKRAGGFPLYLATARGAHVTDLDGHSYVDLCLGDTGAMAGHSPEPV